MKDLPYNILCSVISLVLAIPILVWLHPPWFAAACMASLAYFIVRGGLR